MGLILTDEDFRKEIETLRLGFPKALEANDYVTHLAPRVSELLRTDDQLFNVAVVGQMRVGKSSLLNAIVDRDGLAITGVEETTATINWFKYGEEEQTEKVRVTWKDRAQEEFPREKICDMVGRSEQAAQTACIELFADAPFLKTANLVDTPGTRSAIDSHEGITQGFLAQKHENDTKRLGVEADAIIYVFPPVARENDEELLAGFGQESRIPGSTAYNSIGVLHKWDGLNVEDPVSLAADKAAELAKKMFDKVSTVMSISAPLHLASLKDVSFWDTIHELAKQTNPEELDELLDDEHAFIEDDSPSCPISATEREAFRKTHSLPWPTLRLMLRHGSRTRFENSSDFKEWARTASGIEELREELKRRFFSRSNMIRNLGLLSKIHAPGYEAVTILENKKMVLSADIDRLPDHIKKVKQVGDPSLEGVVRYLETQQSENENRLGKLIRNHKTIDSLIHRTRNVAEPINLDLKAIEHLDEKETYRHIPANIQSTVRLLLGGKGFDLESRFSGSVEDAEKLLDELQELQPRLPSKAASVIGQAMDRLEQIADHLEENPMA